MTGAQGQYATKILRLASGNVIDHSRMYACLSAEKSNADGARQYPELLYAGRSDAGWPGANESPLLRQAPESLSVCHRATAACLLLRH